MSTTLPDKIDKVAVVQIAATDHSPGVTAVEIAFKDGSLLTIGGTEKPPTEAVRRLVRELIQEVLTNDDSQ